MRGESKNKKVLPVIIWANGTISKSFTKYPGNVPGKQEIKLLQKTAILGTANTVESVNVTVKGEKGKVIPITGLCGLQGG